MRRSKEAVSRGLTSSSRSSWRTIADDWNIALSIEIGTESANNRILILTLSDSTLAIHASLKIIRHNVSLDFKDVALMENAWELA